MCRSAVVAAAAVHERDVCLLEDLRQLNPLQDKAAAQIARGTGKTGHSKTNLVMDAPAAYGFTSKPPSFNRTTSADNNAAQVGTNETVQTQRRANERVDTAFAWKERYLTVFTRMLQLEGNSLEGRTCPDGSGSASRGGLRCCLGNCAG